MHHGANADMVAEDGEGTDAAADHATMENAAADMQVTGDDAVENMEVTSGTVVNGVVAGTEGGQAQHEHTRHQHADEVRAAPTRTGRATCVYRDYKYTRAWASTKETVYRCSKFRQGCPGKMELLLRLWAIRVRVLTLVALPSLLTP
ncbi:hypothetical protein PI124_g9134 [Phytophthora idaei]|nr:hypothetical protein PI125_g20760 [Phytophthora idaei]KAG3171964.1 hypothetical protein PI126_g1642 [Phytophthora idaei]KAG3246138.1 hypothetical protein PI124_g9134 [Phytophthora idaei]